MVSDEESIRKSVLCPTSAISSVGNGTCRLRYVRFTPDSYQMANPNSTLAFESRFGPQSNLIDITAFVQSASNQTPFQAGEVDREIIQECRYVILLPTLAK